MHIDEVPPEYVIPFKKVRSPRVQFHLLSIESSLTFGFYPAGI